MKLRIQEVKSIYWDDHFEQYDIKIKYDVQRLYFGLFWITLNRSRTKDNAESYIERYKELNGIL